MSGADRGAEPVTVRGADPITVLAIVADEDARALFPRVVLRDRLFVTADPGEALTLAQEHAPAAAFVEIGSGAGLATVHHLKALLPSVTIFALASRDGLEAAANAVALGGAGLMMLPLGGDEILSSIESVKARLHEKTVRARLEEGARLSARADGWMGRVAELADCPSRAAAAEQLAAVLVEATGAAGAAIYLSATATPGELLCAAVSTEIDAASAFGTESELLDHARSARLLVVPLATRSLKVGYALLAVAPGAAPSSFGEGGPRSLRAADGLVKLLATQSAPALAFLAERDRAVVAPVRDPGSTAYSFAYYVDVAGRELDKARRYGRRFSLVNIALDPAEADGLTLRAAEMAEQILLCTRDIDVLARVDEGELRLLLPEADGLAAHACRRRILGRFAEKGTRLVPRGLLIGAATFPHDGRDLAQLLRVARHRAEATRTSVVHRLGADTESLDNFLEALEGEADAPPPEDITTPRPLALPLAEAAALAASVAADALRGGAVIVTVAHHAGLRLGDAVRAALAPLRANVTLHALEVRPASGEDVEALSIIAEHGSYALIGRVSRDDGGVIKGFHAADPLLADALADHLGRAAGLRIFA